VLSPIVSEPKLDFTRLSPLDLHVYLLQLFDGQPSRPESRLDNSKKLGGGIRGRSQVFSAWSVEGKIMCGGAVPVILAF
jgi:hypothetical protein